MMTAYSTIENAVEAIKLGAFDYITKPFQMDQMLFTVDKALETTKLRREVRELRRALEREHGTDQIIGQDPSMRELLDMIKQIAQDRRVDRPAARRHWNGQGPGGTRGPPQLGEGRSAVCKHYLHGALPRRCSKVSSSGTSAVRSPTPRRRRRGSSSSPRGGRCTWTRSATCRRRYRPSCCASSRSAASGGWVARVKSRSTYG